MSGWIKNLRECFLRVDGTGNVQPNRFNASVETRSDSAFIFKNQLRPYLRLFSVRISGR